MHFKILHMKKILLPIIAAFIFSSCKPAAEETNKSTGFTYNKPGGAPPTATRASSMVLTSPTYSPNFDSTPTFTINGVVSGETVKIYSNATCTADIGSVVASGSSVTFTSTVLLIGTHKFYTKSSNEIHETACSGIMATYNYLGISPTNATSMVLTTPAASPGTDSTPTFTMTGVVPSETVNIYTDSSCSVPVGSALAHSTTVSISASALAPGIYPFYTNSTNIYGTSECSNTMALYEYEGVVPTTASSLVIKLPIINPNYDPAPTITAYGVANGDTVNIFVDAGCTIQVGSAYATSTSVDVPISSLPVGSHSFFTFSTNVKGASACSSALAFYEYLGISPTVRVSWTANRESAVNRIGGGYRVYFSTTNNFNVANASYVDVPYVSGASSPTSYDFTGLMAGIYYFKVVAYSSLNPPGQTSGSKSNPSSQFQVSLP
jgi:hypothetical protein